MMLNFKKKCIAYDITKFTKKQLRNKYIIPKCKVQY